MNPLSYLPGSHTLHVVQLALGALAGWLLHPLVWVIAGPFRWLALILATASQESAYNPTASGDEGRSVGILQFYDSTWESITGRPLDDRTSPFLQGFYSARYVSTALLTSWWWWTAALPVFGYGVVRVMWTNGISASTAERVFELAPAKLDTANEGRGPGSWVLWRGLSFIPAGLALYVLWRARGALGKLRAAR